MVIIIFNIYILHYFIFQRAIELSILFIVEIKICIYLSTPRKHNMSFGEIFIDFFFFKSFHNMRSLNYFNLEA